jgi:RhoGAP domain
MFDEQYADDVHTIAALLKNFFASLPNPIFSFEFYQPLLDVFRRFSLFASVPPLPFLSLSLSLLLFRSRSLSFFFFLSRPIILCLMSYVSPSL